MIAIGVIVFCIVSGVFVFIAGRENSKAFKKIMDDMPKLIDLGIALVESRGEKNDSR